MFGTTRSRVKAFMGKFKMCGFVEGHSGVLYVNPARLSVVRDGDRRISTAVSAAIPRAPESEDRSLTSGWMMKRVLALGVALLVDSAPARCGGY
jgi:hypothetical protein